MKTVFGRFKVSSRCHVNGNCLITWQQVSVGLPCVSGLSEHLSRVLRAQYIRTYNKHYNTLRSILVHPKDRTPTEKKTGVVHDITFNDCGEHYICETSRTLEKRYPAWQSVPFSFRQAGVARGHGDRGNKKLVAGGEGQGRKGKACF